MYQELQERESYSDCPTEEEMRYKKAVAFCSRCKTNWSRLHRCDEEGDEQYQFCPTCRTAEFLEDGRPGETFSMSEIIGQTNSDYTGLPLVHPLPALPEMPKSKDPFTQHVEKKEITEAAEDRALDAYHKAYETGGQLAGEQAYREELKKGRNGKA